MATPGETDGARAVTRRIGAFDALRGFSVVSMVLFHLCYDLVVLASVEISWFAPPLMDVWRASISWTFLFVAGCMCALSRDNLRRGLEYACVALGIYVVTSVAAVDTPISFGIIYCMSACTLVAWLLSRVGALPRGHVAACLLFLCFLALLPLHEGHVGLGGASVALPDCLSSATGFAWLGLPDPGFASGDYYPLLPYLMLYLAGVAMGRAWSDAGWPRWAVELDVTPLNLVGRHALLVYVAHQPVLLLVCSLVAPH